MWKNADEVPGEVADQILERWDKTTPELQRKIVLQAFLDIERLRADLAVANEFLSLATEPQSKS